MCSEGRQVVTVFHFSVSVTVKFPCPHDFKSLFWIIFLTAPRGQERGRESRHPFRLENVQAICKYMPPVETWHHLQREIILKRYH